jgi:cytosine/adenosine deaminase-related metal-dependent hydrolase
MEFFAGSGREGRRLAEFLEARGFRREEAGITARRPLAHLINLGVVDRNTLLVHGVQLNRGEARDLAGTGASLCLCPRSNLGLVGDMAPAPDLLAAWVNLALGTDSLASSPDLSLWAEMAALLERFPGLDPEAALTMAAPGGARALGMGFVFGRIRNCAVVALAFAPLAALPAGDVIEAVVRGELAGPPAKAAG